MSIRGVAEIPAAPDRYYMHSFQNWLEHRLATIPDATSLGLVIAQAGEQGISRDELLRQIGVSPNVLEILLRGLLVAGQVAMVKVGGGLRYRAAG